MPKINPRIKSIDDLLGLDAAEESPIEPTPSVSLPTKNTIITLPPQAIRAFRGHPFRLYEGDRLNDLVESISEHGVLNPAIIRKIERDEDGFEYEMLAGHNRQNAAAIANRELPCIVKENLSDEDAWIYVIETNVLQRSFSEMLPSEKAAVLALRYSKMICQGRRNDIIEELKKLENPDEIKENSTSGTQCHRTKSRDILGAEYDLKGRAVANYLRINELITPLKRRIDDAEFPIVAAVQLSFLTEQEQQMVDDVLSENEYKVNEGKAVLLREYTGKLTPERTEQILSGEFNRKPKKSTATAFKVKPAIYKKYFTASISQKEFDSIVDEALALYFAQKGQESEQEAGYAAQMSVFAGNKSGARRSICDWNANQQLDFRTVRHAAVFAAAGVGTLWLVLLRHLDRSFCQTNLCAGIEAGGRRLSTDCRSCVERCDRTNFPQ